MSYHLLRRRLLALVGSGALTAAVLAPAAAERSESDAATPPPAANTPAAAAGQTAPAVSPPPALPTETDLFQLGRSLFEAYAPDEIKEQFEFPSRAEWDRFMPKLQAALAGDSFAALADCEDEARGLLAALRLWPDAAGYADWLEERLEYITAARALRPPAAPPAAITPPAPARPAAPSAPPPTRPPTAPPPPKKIAPTRPSAPSAPVPVNLEVALPGYGLWLAKVRHRPRPPRADQWLPVARQAFVLAQTPPALAWLAEIESSFNPAARSPAGAVGLFQLTAPTAQTLGLRTWLPDERLQPATAARAAARLLSDLHQRFDDWPLALAAYNAGEGRVRRALASRTGPTRFAAIAPTLPVETRLYVPRVYALLMLREGAIPPAVFPRQ